MPRGPTRLHTSICSSISEPGATIENLGGVRKLASRPTMSGNDAPGICRSVFARLGRRLVLASSARA